MVEKRPQRKKERGNFLNNHRQTNILKIQLIFC